MISVRLVDAPGDFKAVNVEVVDVMIKMDDDNDDDSGWTSLEAENEIINLLDFTGGISKVLVDRFAIPAGTLSQMRLVLGDGNTIVIENDLEEDEEFDLKTPSAQQSGLKLKVNAVMKKAMRMILF
jgi:predicted component of type VI protein secretion system